MDTNTAIAILGAAAFLALLVAATAAESIVVSLSRWRARGLAARDGARAVSLQRYVQERTRLLATLRFARNVALIGGTALVVQAVFIHTSPRWQPLLLTAGAAFLLTGLLEAVPAVLAARNPEGWGLALTPLIGLLRLLFWLPTWLLSLPAVLLARILPLPEPTPEEVEEEELLRLVEREEQNGGIEEEERQMIRGVIKLVETTAREIMVPRIDIAAVEANATLEDVERVIVERGYSRIPLYEGSIDNIIGVIYAKDVLRCLSEGRRPIALREIARPPYFIPETKKVDELLTELRQNKIHMAIVVDEYGGTAGLVTTEDIIEVIVGEIEDEYDVAEAPIERVSEVEAILDARVGIDALNELFDLDLPNEDYDTVGGIIYAELGKVPVAGDEVEVDGIRLHVLSVIGRRIKKVRVTKLQAQPAET